MPKTRCPSNVSTVCSIKSGRRRNECASTRHGAIRPDNAEQNDMAGLIR